MSAETRTGRLGPGQHKKQGLTRCLPGTQCTGAGTEEGLTTADRLELPGYLTARPAAPVFLRQEDMSLAPCGGDGGGGGHRALGWFQY